MNTMLVCISGTVITQISSLSVSSSASKCLDAVDTCMSDLCKTEEAFNSGICGGNNDSFSVYGFSFPRIFILYILITVAA